MCVVLLVYLFVLTCVLDVLVCSNDLFVLSKVCWLVCYKLLNRLLINNYISNKQLIIKYNDMGYIRHQ